MNKSLKTNKKNIRKLLKSKLKLLIKPDGLNSRKKLVKEKLRDKGKSLTRPRRKKTIRRPRLLTIIRKRKKQLIKPERWKLLH